VAWVEGHDEGQDDFPVVLGLFWVFIRCIFFYEGDYY
jgi:hypothetical protein